LATEFVRFVTVRLLSLGVCEISCLCQQTTSNSWAQGGDWTCYWRNWAAIMRKCHREFRQKRKSVPAESWGTFFGYCVPQLIAVCLLYTEIKIPTLFEEMMCFIRKLNLALLLGHPIQLKQPMSLGYSYSYPYYYYYYGVYLTLRYLLILSKYLSLLSV